MNPGNDEARPLFGEIATDLFGISGDEIRSCLDEQQASGLKTGELLVRRGLMTRRQVFQVLGRQAEWQASAPGRTALPYPATFSLCLPAYNEQDNIEDASRRLLDPPPLRRGLRDHRGQ